MIRPSGEPRTGGRCAICIPTYNQSVYLRLSVLSAIEQGQGTEVWIGDDASTDETAEVMAALCKEHPQIRYLRSPANRGIAENCSWLLSQPQCEYVVRLDSDDQLLPGYVATILPWMERNPRAGYAHTAVTNIDAGGRALGDRRLARPTGFQPADDALRASAKGYRTAANILTFRTEALRTLDYYRGRPEFVEDYDLAVRMAAAGYGNIYIDQPLALYRVWADAENKRARRKRLQLQGYTRIFGESLEPAFAARGWNLHEIRRGRRRLSLMNAAYCHQPIFTPVEQSELRELLCRLGDSRRLRLRFWLVRIGLGPLFEWGQRGTGVLKNLIKSMLSRSRGATPRGIAR